MITLKEISLAVERVKAGPIGSFRTAADYIGVVAAASLIISETTGLIVDNSRPGSLEPHEIDNSAFQVLENALPKGVYERLKTPHILFFLEKCQVLDNYSACSIMYEDKVWPTVEHLYQASKFRDQVIVERIRNANSPQEAKNIAYSPDLKPHKREDWNEIKITRMRFFLRQKASQHAIVREVLIESNGYALIEDSKGDYFWGAGETMDGFNHLGKLWERIRAEIILSPFGWFNYDAVHILD